MAASDIAVIYAENSRVIRRIIVADSDQDLARAVRKVAGEAVCFIPFEEYSQANDAAVRAAVAKLIGEPTKPDRCVEVDAAGKVVAVYAADPLIDQPLVHKDHALELHPWADVNDEKVGAEFVSTKPAPVDTGERPGPKP